MAHSWGWAALRAPLPPLMHEWKGALMGSAGTGGPGQEGLANGPCCQVPGILARGREASVGRGLGGWVSCLVLWLLSSLRSVLNKHPRVLSSQSLAGCGAGTHHVRPTPCKATGFHCCRRTQGSWKLEAAQGRAVRPGEPRGCLSHQSTP